MKKFYLLFLFISIFVILIQPVYAQTSLTLIPGKDCGNPEAEDHKGRRCCFYKSQKVSLPRTNIVPIDSLTNTLSGLFDKYLTPVLNPIDELIQKTVLPCVDSVPSTPENLTDPSCKCIYPTVAPIEKLEPLCMNIDRSRNNYEYNKCLACLNGVDGKVGIWSGLGCIYTDAKSFVQETVFRLGIGLAGGLALLCLIYAAFQMQTSQGNPEKLKKSQEMITSCIMGLMLIIFSVFILRLIGVNILTIPGFG